MRCSGSGWRGISASSLALTAIILAPAGVAELGSVRVASGLSGPLYVTHAPGRDDSLFIVERGGAIRILDLNTNTVNTTPFLTIPDVNTTGEGGLLSLAFHPDFATNGLFYTYSTSDPTTTGPALTSHVREYSLSGDPDVADPTARTILSFDQPQSNHNGGWIGFSPIETGANLYVTTGDGGGGDDNDAGHTAGTGNAQDTTDNLLGKVLRINVDGDDFAADPSRNYAIPATNPFVGETGDDEIWAYGLRNPYRASFDRVTGDFYIGDVGQGAREEIDFQPASSTGGENYGWRLREGAIATPSGGVGGPPPTDNVDPIYDYLRGTGDFQGTTVIGGYLYRGPVAELQGLYIFGDFGSDHVWAFDPANPYNTVMLLDDMITPDEGEIANIAAFGEDAAGNLYIVNLIGGEVFRIVPEPTTAALMLLGLAGLATCRRKPSRCG